MHAAEIVRPLWARWVVNWVLPLFAPALPSSPKSLTHDEQTAMLDAALAAAPKSKHPAGADYVFLLLFEREKRLST